MLFWNAISQRLYNSTRSLFSPSIVLLSFALFFFLIGRYIVIIIWSWSGAVVFFFLKSDLVIDRPTLVRPAIYLDGLDINMNRLMSNLINPTCIKVQPVQLQNMNRIIACSLYCWNSHVFLGLKPISLWGLSLIFIFCSLALGEGGPK